MNELVEKIAAMCHNTNALYCESLGEDVPDWWEDVSDEQKESVTTGVVFALSHPRAGAINLHEAWLRYKKDDGWKVGKTKDEKKKIHPSLVPWEALPEETRRKNRIFLGIVRAFQD